MGQNFEIIYIFFPILTWVKQHGIKKCGANGEAGMGVMGITLGTFEEKMRWVVKIKNTWEPVGTHSQCRP